MKVMVNRRVVDTDARAGEVALDLVREHLGLTATKEGCREGDCGACTILVGEPGGGRIRYRPVNSCILPVGGLAGCHLVTLEGLNGDRLSPVQQEIVAHGATQCGFCTPGIVVAATAFLLEAPVVSRRRLVDALAGNICRCTGYASIIRALHGLADRFSDLPSPGPDRIEVLSEAGVVPGYFSEAPAVLSGLAEPPPRIASKGEAVAVGGGTDLFVQRPETLRDASLRFVARPSADPVVAEGDRIRIDAAATVDDLQAAAPVRALIPAIDEVARLIASPQIRARGTVAGNLANASPIGDLSIVFLALDATVILRAAGAQRELPLHGLFRGYKDLDLRPGELIDHLTIPVPPGDVRFGFEKVSRRIHLDIASVNTAMRVVVDGDAIAHALISAGGVAPIPLCLTRASAWLAGRRVSADTAREAARIASEEVTPIDDVRGSADYKRRLLERLIAAHFLTLFGVEVTP